MPHHLNHNDIIDTVRALSQKIRFAYPYPQFKLYPVPRGGVPVAYLLSGYLPGAIIVNSPELADIIVDDLIDSGSTLESYRVHGKPFYALFTKSGAYSHHAGTEVPSDKWLVFPWEGTETGSAEDIGIRLLQYIGEDPTREGLRETPARFLKAWKFWTKGYREKVEDIMKVFEDGAEGCDEMIVVKDIPIYSHCEHHLAMIIGTATVAYIPNGKILGLSKIARVVEVFARRLQVQERLTNQIAEALQTHLDPKGVAVSITARHMCMESRGVEKPGAATVTQALRGVFKTDPAARAEFMGLVR